MSTIAKKTVRLEFSKDNDVYNIIMKLIDKIHFFVNYGSAQTIPIGGKRYKGKMPLTRDTLIF